MSDDQFFPVPAEWADRALVDSAKYDEMYQASIDDPEAFWAEHGQRIAGDIARALDQDVVWAWPDPEGQAENASLEDAIGQHLFTRVIPLPLPLARAPAPVAATARWRCKPTLPLAVVASPCTRTTTATGAPVA